MRPIILCLSLFVWSWTACDAYAKPLKVAPFEQQEIEGRAQGTTYRIIYLGPRESTAGIALKVKNSLADIDRVFSNYREDSEISRFNADKSQSWVGVAPELATMVAEGLEVSRKTKGAFDITLGQLLKLWKFGAFHEKQKQKSVPSDEAIALALRKTGYSHLEARLHPPSLKKDIPDLIVDLSGIGQGYSVDRLALLLESLGIKSYLVELGGELRSKGLKSDGGSYHVAVETPTESSGSVAQVITLNDSSLSTSGSYRDFFEWNGKRYSHIFDPRVGKPIESDVASATVLTQRCQDADAFAKAFLILTENERKELARETGFSVLLQVHKGRSMEMKYLGDMERHISRQ